MKYKVKITKELSDETLVTDLLVTYNYMRDDLTIIWQTTTTIAQAVVLYKDIVVTYYIIHIVLNFLTFI